MWEVNACTPLWILPWGAQAHSPPKGDAKHTRTFISWLTSLLTGWAGFLLRLLSGGLPFSIFGIAYEGEKEGEKHASCSRAITVWQSWRARPRHRTRNTEKCAHATGEAGLMLCNPTPGTHSVPASLPLSRDEFQTDSKGPGDLLNRLLSFTHWNIAL